MNVSRHYIMTMEWPIFKT